MNLYQSARALYRLPIHHPPQAHPRSSRRLSSRDCHLLSSLHTHDSKNGHISCSWSNRISDVPQANDPAFPFPSFTCQFTGSFSLSHIRSKDADNFRNCQSTRTHHHRALRGPFSESCRNWMRFRGCFY